MKIESRYSTGSYLDSNPDWHRGDSEWKALQVAAILKAHSIAPDTICEVGCGSGDTLFFLKQHFPASRLFGYDISPQAAEFWLNRCDSSGGGRNFVLGDFHQLNTTKHEILLMLDVFEHVRDPFTFLESSKEHAKRFVFHIPLDLSASGVLRKQPLLSARRKVGHLHFYTKDLALEILKDCGYRIVEWRYTGASLNSPNRSIITKSSGFLRRLAYSINKDWGVRLLGGETLIVLAE